MPPPYRDISEGYMYCKGGAWFQARCWIAIQLDPAQALLPERGELAAWFLAHCYRRNGRVNRGAWTIWRLPWTEAHWTFVLTQLMVQHYCKLDANRATAKAVNGHTSRLTGHGHIGHTLAPAPSACVGSCVNTRRSEELSSIHDAQITPLSEYVCPSVKAKWKAW